MRGKLTHLSRFMWHRPAVSGNCLRRSRLQRIPNRISNNLPFASKSSVPESQYFHSSGFQRCISFLILQKLIGKSVLRTVQFDVERSFDAEEIKNVRTERVLAAEFVGREATVSEPGPQQLLGPGILFAEHTRDAGQPWRIHGRSFESWSTSSICSSPRLRSDEAGKCRLQNGR